MAMGKTNHRNLIVILMFFLMLAMPSYAAYNNPNATQSAWTKYSGNPVFNHSVSPAWDSMRVQHPMIYQNFSNTSEWIMDYYGLKSGDSFPTGIGMARSQDYGYTWTRIQTTSVLNTTYPVTTIWDPHEVSSNSIIQNQSNTSQLLMYYSAWNNSWGRGFTMLARGDWSFTNWAKETSGPILSCNETGGTNCNEIYHPKVVYNGTHYLMFYGHNNASSSWTGVYLAWSTNGVDFTKYSIDDKNPVVQRPNGYWFSSLMQPNDAKIINNQIFVLYLGRNWTAGIAHNYSLGFANCTMDGLTCTNLNMDDAMIEPQDWLGGGWEGSEISGGSFSHSSIDNSYIVYYHGWNASNYVKIGWANQSDGTIDDTIPPTFSNIDSNVTNNTAVNTGTAINISVQWTDDVQLSMYVNSSKVNTSGSWTNGTWSAFSSGNWSNFTIFFPSEIGSNITVKIYANDTSDNENVTGTWFWWNTTPPSNTAPRWVANSNKTSYPSNYSSITTTNFQIEWTDDSDANGYNVSVLEIDSTNYTTTRSNNISYANMTLGAGTHNYRWYANDSSNVWNTTGQWTFYIGNASVPLVLENNISWVGTYPSSTNTTGSGCPSGLTCNLYRNDTGLVSNSNIILLGGGGYNYTYNTTGNANYSHNATSNILTISASPNPVNVYINGNLNQNVSVVSGTTINVTGTQVLDTYNRDRITIYMYRNNILVNSTNWDSIFYINSTMPDATYEFKVNTTYNENYTANSTGLTFLVTLTSQFTLYNYNEEDNSSIVFNVTLSNLTFTFTEYNLNNFTSNTTNMPYGDVTIQYEASTFPQRKRYKIVSVGDIDTIHVYSLDSSSGHNVNFYIANELENPIANVLVTAWRLVGTSWVVVDQEKSDASGSAQLYLKSTAQYMLKFNRTGYSDYNVNVTPSESTYKVYMSQTGGLTVNYTPTMWENITFIIKPYGFVLVNTTDLQTFNYTIVASDSKLEWWGMNLTHSNGTVLYSNNSTTSSGGWMAYSMNLSAEYGNSILMKVWFKKEGFNPWIDPRNITVELYTGRGLANIFSYMRDNMSPFVIGIVAIFCSMGVAGMVSVEKMPFVGKLGGGVVMLGVLAMFTYYFTTTIWGWMMWILTSIFVVFLLYIKGGW